MQITHSQDNEIDAKNQVDLNGSLMNVNLIHEKLREKKQQQLRELRAIQEEIKEGKLVPPPSTSSFPSTQNASNQRPPPNTKLHTTPNSPTSHVPQNGAYPSWPPVKMHCLLPPAPASSFPWKSRDRVDTQEILLAPRCLPHHYMHWNPPPHASNRCGRCRYHQMILPSSLAMLKYLTKLTGLTEKNCEKFDMSATDCDRVTTRRKRRRKSRRRVAAARRS